MKAVKGLTDEQIVKQGVTLLHRGLGPAATRRFMTLTRPPREDSVIRHRKWQEKLKKDQFFDAVFGRSAK